MGAQSLEPGSIPDCELQPELNCGRWSTPVWSWPGGNSGKWMDLTSDRPTGSQKAPEGSRQAKPSMPSLTCTFSLPLWLICGPQRNIVSVCWPSGSRECWIWDRSDLRSSHQSMETQDPQEGPGGYRHIPQLLIHSSILRLTDLRWHTLNRKAETSPATQQTVPLYLGRTKSTWRQVNSHKPVGVLAL